MASIVRNPKSSPIQLAGPSAIQIVIYHVVGTSKEGETPPPQVRRVQSRACLEHTGPSKRALMRNRIELGDREGSTIYYAPFARPGYAEVYGRSQLAWHPLPVGHCQVLVAIVPDLPVATRFAVFADGEQWLEQALELPPQI